MERVGDPFNFVDLTDALKQRCEKAGVKDCEFETFFFTGEKGGWKYFHDKNQKDFHVQIPKKHLHFVEKDQVVFVDHLFRFKNLDERTECWLEDVLGSGFEKKVWKLTSIQGQRKTIEHEGVSFTVSASKKFFHFEDGKVRTYIERPRLTDEEHKKILALLGENYDCKFYVYVKTDGIRAILADAEENEYLVQVPWHAMRFIGGDAPKVDWRVSTEDKRLIVLDFETESLSTDSKILQMSMLIEEDGKKSGVSCYVNHETYDINPGATKVHGITNDDWRTNCSIINERAMIRMIIAEMSPDKTNVIVGHNALRFDYIFLMKLAEKHGLKIPMNVEFLDTYVMAKEIIKEGRRNLNACREFLCLSNEKMVKKTKKIFKPTPEDYDISGLEASEEELLKELEDSIAAHNSCYDVVVTYYVFKKFQDTVLIKNKFVS